MKARCLADGRDMRRVVIEQTAVYRYVKRERYECPDCGAAAPIWWADASIVAEWLERQRPSHSAWKRRSELAARVAS